jgi:exonuclease V gamma subunit
MSMLYLGTDLTSLATKLAEVLDEVIANDCFRPVKIVVPNRNVGKWLKLWLARRDGVAINLQFAYLEEVLWDLLQDLDPRQHPVPLLPLGDEHYQLLALVALLEQDDKKSRLEPLRQYLGPDRGKRNWWGRAWNLADRLTGLIRDYEYHRHEAVIRKWLCEQDAYPDQEEHDLAFERAHRALFWRITRPDRPEEGLRAQLGNALVPQKKICKTMPQYAGELRQEVKATELRIPDKPGVVPLFGVTQLSAFHVDLLHWLGRGQYYDLRLFYPNPLIGQIGKLPSKAARIREKLEELAAPLRGQDGGAASRPASGASGELLRVWGTAAAESMALLADLLIEPFPFMAELVAPSVRPAPPKVLHCLQNHLLGVEKSEEKKLGQDKSLQIVGCPGIYREVETVHSSILQNLLQEQELKQTDVAILVTDLPRYRPAIQAVFHREPRPLSYNLADVSAAEVSTFAAAVHSLLDLALESFTRARVFDVVLNPCFLARLGVDREQASTWLHWAEELGVYHGWNGQDNEQRGYANSARFGWQLALRRLRLGRIMTPADDRSDGPAPSYKEVIPHADLWSSGRDQLDAFCLAVEGLLPRLARLRTASKTGVQWAEVIRRLVDDFLLVPEELRADAQVRDRLFRQLDNLRLLGHLLDGEAPLPLALVRELVTGALEKTLGPIGQTLTEGVTIGTLELLQGLPFRVIYVLGLGESLFPGADPRSALDLRNRQRLRGDIRPPETNRFRFLEALLAARDKIYLVYNCRELQRDQTLHPSSVINQLRRYLKKHVIGKEFEVAKAPLRVGALECFRDCPEARPFDVPVDFSTVHQLVAIQEGRDRGELKLTKAQEAQVEMELARYCKVFDLGDTQKRDNTPGAQNNTSEPQKVTLRELVSFLRCPAEAALRRHLRLQDEEQPEARDDELFYIDRWGGYRLLREAQERFVRRATREGVDVALDCWKADFTAQHKEWQLRCRAPEGAFGDADRARFLADLQQRIETAGLAEFLRQQADRQFIGPVRIGPSFAPVGATTILPALKLETSRGAVELVGTEAMAWADDKAIALLTIHTGSWKKVKPNELCRPMLAPLLFGLALRAGGGSGADAQSYLRFAGRELLINVAHEKRVQCYSWSPEDLPATEARNYLTVLAGDFLDPSSFDLLPIDILIGIEELHRAFLQEELPTEGDKKAYAADFQERVEEDGEKDQNPLYYPMKLLKVVPATVPEDAFDKVRRRFRPLDRSLAHARGPRTQ